MIRHLQRFACAADFIAVQRYLQPFRRFLGSEPVPFPGERPVQPVRSLLGVRFFGQKIPITGGFRELGRQKILRRFLRRLAARLPTGLRFGNFVFVAGDVSFRAHADLKFFFLLRFEKAHVPVPHIHFGRHHPVGFLQSDLPL